jgi:hypothetical protein
VKTFKLYIISGCNGSGKTTASYAVLPELLKCSEFVNSDEFAKGLSPFNPEKASIGASRLMLLKIRYLLSQKKTFAIETTLATRSLRKLITEAQEAGYFVTIIYFWLKSPNLAVERVRARVLSGGHNIGESTIRRRYGVGLSYFFDLYMKIADRWILADNSTIPFKVVAQGWRENMVVRDNKKFEDIKKQALEYTRESYQTLIKNDPTD